jgi:hypothetical protein
MIGILTPKESNVYSILFHMPYNEQQLLISRYNEQIKYTYSNFYFPILRCK